MAACVDSGVMLSRIKAANRRPSSPAGHPRVKWATVSVYVSQSLSMSARVA